MRVLPIRYCADMAASTRFYRALGLALGDATRTGSWVELPAATGALALHRAMAAEAGTCELAFEADEPLEAVADRLRSAGFPPDAIVDESHGRSLRVRDPDGVLVQVNESDRSLYT
ncbi:MAG TPA: VOC family protein [Mycobacteriales bacterium]|jgi:catechol 2,3-dioxygenase-like lactoylglutathione lyase family enzyme|nr:VOC family protein [Mycobacteriales bacterium]